MDTILCNQGYIINKDKISDELLKAIKKDLKVKPFVLGQRANFVKGFKIYLENDNKISVPKFYGIDKFGEPTIKDYNNSKDINVNFIGNLRDYQIKVIENVIPKIKKEKGGTISLPPGRGKTVIACKILSELKKKTLVIVHKTFLLNQWTKRLEQFIPGIKVGKIQGQEFNIENNDVVIGMLQTLSLKDNYSEDIFDDFGLVIFDECHHLSAEKFSKILRKISIPYMIGLSGTPNRNDKLEKVFEYYIGEMLYYEKPQVNQEILVNIYKFTCEHERFELVINKHTKEAQVATMISNMIEIEERNKLIENLIIKCREEKERKILILSDRLDHLDKIKNSIDSIDIGTTSKYIGGMKQHLLDEAENADIIFSTYSMSSEALDISSLNTIILSTSRKNVEQSVGRILRKQDNYLAQPLVIDIVDNIKVFVNQSYIRKSYYKKITKEENIKTYNYLDGEIQEVINKKQPIDIEKSLFMDSDSE